MVPAIQMASWALRGQLRAPLLGSLVLRAAAWGLFLQGLDPRKPAESILVRLDKKSTVYGFPASPWVPYTTQPSLQSQDGRRVVPTTMSVAAGSADLLIARELPCPMHQITTRFQALQATIKANVIHRDSNSQRLKRVIPRAKISTSPPETSPRHQADHPSRSTHRQFINHPTGMSGTTIESTMSFDPLAFTTSFDASQLVSSPASPFHFPHSPHKQSVLRSALCGVSPVSPSPHSGLSTVTTAPCSCSVDDP